MIIIASFVLYFVILEIRTFPGIASSIDWSGREKLWPTYWDEFLLSPFFGRGIGAGLIAIIDGRGGPSIPHNEYLHLLVNGGLIGCLLVIVAMGRWLWELFDIASPNDQEFMLALCPAFAAYAFASDVLLSWSFLPLFAYFGVLLTQPAPLMGPLPEIEHHARAFSEDSLETKAYR